MNIEKTIKSLERNRFTVSYFEQAEDAARIWMRQSTAKWWASVILLL